MWPIVEGWKSGKVGQLIHQEVAGSKALKVLYQHRTIWKGHCGSSFIQPQRGVQVLQIEVGNDAVSVWWLMYGSSSSHTVSRKEVDSIYDHTTGKVSPWASGHRWLRPTLQREGSAFKRADHPGRRQLRLSEGCLWSKRWWGARKLSLRPSKAVDDMGGSWEEKVLMEKAVEDGGTSDQLHLASYLRHPPISQKPQTVVCEDLKCLQCLYPASLTLLKVELTQMWAK